MVAMASCDCCKHQIDYAGDQHGNIRVWDLTANACSCELVPEVGTAVRSLTVALDGSLVVAANNQGVALPCCARPNPNPMQET